MWQHCAASKLGYAAHFIPREQRRGDEAAFPATLLKIQRYQSWILALNKTLGKKTLGINKGHKLAARIKKIQQIFVMNITHLTYFILCKKHFLLRPSLQAGLPLQTAGTSCHWAACWTTTSGTTSRWSITALTSTSPWTKAHCGCRSHQDSPTGTTTRCVCVAVKQKKKKPVLHSHLLMSFLVTDERGSRPEPRLLEVGRVEQKLSRLFGKSSLQRRESGGAR